jgi:hypothetical protein
MEKFIQGFGGKHERKRLHGRYRRSSEDNIKMDLKGIRWKRLD